MEYSFGNGSREGGGKNFRRTNGFSLVEVVIAVSILSILVLVLAVLMLASAKGLVKSGEQIRAQRVARTIHVHLESMNFFDVFSCDSSRPFFGLTSHGAGGLHSAPYRPLVSDPFAFYPSSTALLAMQAAVREAGLARFTLDVLHMRRDRSAVRSADVTTNLIPFTDISMTINPSPPTSLSAYTMGDGYDDYDPMIRYNDINGDGAYYGRYFLGISAFPASLPVDCVWMPWSGSGVRVMGCLRVASLPSGLNWRTHQSLTEMPDTRLKQVNLGLWNTRGDLVHQEGWVISEGGFSGGKVEEWESVLTLNVQQPIFSTNLYSLQSLAQTNSHSLSITKAYPGLPPAFRADLVSPLVIFGQSAPLATVGFTTSPAITSSGFSSMDSGTVDADGNFSVNAVGITNVLVEGNNTISGMASKGWENSPLWSTPLIYDTRPPFFVGQTPPNLTSPVKTRSPFLAVQLFDDTSSTTAVSGIAKEVIYVSTRVTSSFESASFLYRDGWANYGTDWLVLASTQTGLIDPLPDNHWVDIKVEGGDYAHYKTTSTWKVKINIDNSDSSSPTIKVPLLTSDGCSVDVTAGIPKITCDLDDPDSGIDWRSIWLTVNTGSSPTAPYIAQINMAATPRMGDYFDPKTVQTGGRLTYQFPAAIPSGVYCLAVSVANWRGISSSLPPILFSVP